MFRNSSMSINARVVIVMALIVGVFKTIRVLAIENNPPSHATTLVSLDSNELQANSSSNHASVSLDGRYIAFDSSSSNLVSGDMNNAIDIFVRDTQTGVTTIVSVSSNEVQANADSANPSISADGRYVAFESDATNLVSGENNAVPDIFLRDLQLGTTTRVSIDSSGKQGFELSYEPSISADGRYVAFYSASPLVIGDLNGYSDVFVRDTVANTTALVSVDSNGIQGNSFSQAPAISPDGGFVVFDSDASNLVSGDTNNEHDIFLRDLKAGTTIRVSVDSNEMEGTGDSGYPSVSLDGRYVIFGSWATNLVDGDTNGFPDVFMRDTRAGITTRVSVASSGMQGNQASENASISSDGRYVVFTSWATNMVDQDTNGAADVFIRDMLTNTTTRASVNSNDLEGNYGSWAPAISPDGGYIAFTSWATNLVDGDANGRHDIFKRGAIPPQGDTISPTILSITRANSNPTGAPMVDFHVTFSEPVSAVNPNDFVVAVTGGITGAGVHHVTGFGATRTVTVETGAGNGTLSLNVPLEASIRDLAGNVLKGLPFTGEVYKVDKTPPVSKLIYVDQRAHGAGNGTSWANAYTSLQSALAAASGGDEIWVAAGTYKPTTNTDRTASFSLKSGVAIYGGFAGDETVRTQRNLVANVTTLSGEIGTAGSADNSYHVVTGGDTDNTAVLDGFVITAGNADGLSSSPYENGGGMYNENGSPSLMNVTFQENIASLGGGMGNYGSSPILINVTFKNNSAGYYGGGIYNNNSSPILLNVTLDSNSAVYGGGGIGNYENSNPALTNVTFSGNTASNGGGMENYISSPRLTNVTFSGNAASLGGGMKNYMNRSIIRNSIFYGDLGGEIDNEESTPDVAYSIVQGGYPGTGNIDNDPLLRALHNYGGYSETMALGTGSPSIDAGSDASCPATDQRGVTRPQAAHCDIGAYEVRDSIKISIGNMEINSYSLAPKESKRVSFSGINNGPVKIQNTDPLPMMAAERVVYKVNGIATSFTEMMGLPNSQLDTVYWLPWYNKATAELDTQLRFANVSDATATVHVYIGRQEMTGSPFTLGPGESTRKSFAGINSGPVKIESNVNIVAAERVIFKSAGVNTSFSEMMALPASQLDTTYWLPWYNNVELDTQLRFANVSDTPATVHVYIGGTEMKGSPFTLEPGASTRQSFAGVNSGPVRIESNVEIVAAERVIYKDAGGVNTSFTEMMALPNSQVDKKYSLPWYNNKELDTQLRFANVSDTPAIVHVYIGGVEMAGSPFTLKPDESTRKSFAGVNNGPVQIISNVPIVAAERLIFKFNNLPASFSEMMGLPDSQLNTTYWLPWYNNIDLDTQLRFGVP